MISAKGNIFTSIAVLCTEHYTAPDICIKTLQEQATMQRFACVERQAASSFMDHAGSITKAAAWTPSSKGDCPP